MPENPPPAGHRALTFKDMERLTLDAEHQLCLDGKPIAVRKVTLTRWQARIGIGTSVAIALQALVYIADTICGWL